MASRTTPRRVHSAYQTRPPTKACRPLQLVVHVLRPVLRPRPRPGQQGRQRDHLHSAAARRSAVRRRRQHQLHGADARHEPPVTGADGVLGTSTTMTTSERRRTPPLRRPEPDLHLARLAPGVPARVRARRRAAAGGHRPAARRRRWRPANLGRGQGAGPEPARHRARRRRRARRAAAGHRPYGKFIPDPRPASRRSWSSAGPPPVAGLRHAGRTHRREPGRAHRPCLPERHRAQRQPGEQPDRRCRWRPTATAWSTLAPMPAAPTTTSCSTATSSPATAAATRTSRLTAVHHVFHSEHNRQVDRDQGHDLLATGDAAFIALAGSCRPTRCSGTASACSRPRASPPRCSTSTWCSRSSRARCSRRSTSSCPNRLRHDHQSGDRRRVRARGVPLRPLDADRDGRPARPELRVERHRPDRGLPQPARVRRRAAR